MNLPYLVIRINIWVMMKCADIDVYGKTGWYLNFVKNKIFCQSTASYRYRAVHS